MQHGIILSCMQKYPSIKTNYEIVSIKGYVDRKRSGISLICGALNTFTVMKE
jgi:hypothetical protein